MTEYAATQPPLILKIPQPDVRVKQQSQSRRTSHSFSSFAGDTISPRISKVPFIDPIQALRSSTAVGGTTSATGLPNRVMRIGFFVARTRSSTAEALGFEFRDGNFPHNISSYSHYITPWSIYLTTVLIRASLRDESRSLFGCFGRLSRALPAAFPFSCAVNFPALSLPLDDPDLFPSQAFPQRQG